LNSNSLVENFNMHALSKTTDSQTNLLGKTISFKTSDDKNDPFKKLLMLWQLSQNTFKKLVETATAI
jgi:hypothetical protein